MKACIFVDGENLRHSLCDLFEDLFDRRDYLPKAANWQHFFDQLALTADRRSTRFRTYWYVVEHVDYFPYKFPKNDDTLIAVLKKDKNHRDLLDGLDKEKQVERARQLSEAMKKRKAMFAKRFSGWRQIQEGITREHYAVEFRRAGSILYRLFDGSLGKEKAVDVKLAVDLLELRDIYDLAVIVSGDQDYVPAVREIKDSGKHVVNVSFKKRNGELLPGGARRLNLTVDDCLEIGYEEMKGYMGLGPG